MPDPIPDMVPAAEERARELLSEKSSWWDDPDVEIGDITAFARNNFRDGVLAERAESRRTLEEAATVSARGFDEGFKVGRGQALEEAALWHDKAAAQLEMRWQQANSRDLNTLRDWITNHQSSAKAIRALADKPL